MTSVNFNYLGRKKLQTPRHFDIRKSKKNLTDVLTVDVTLKKSLINLISDNEIIRLEASASKGPYSAVNLSRSPNVQSVSLESFSVNELPNLRVFTVIKEDKARIIRASSSFKLTTSEPVQEGNRPSVPVRREGFFTPEIDYNLGSRPFKLEWDAELIIKMNSRVRELYEMKPASDPMFCGLVFPFLVKEILFGIILRFEQKEDLEGAAKKWLTWAEQLSSSEDGLEQPKGDFKKDADLWIQWVEAVYNLFCSTRYLNNMTLLDAMESSV